MGCRGLGAPQAGQARGTHSAGTAEPRDMPASASGASDAQALRPPSLCLATPAPGPPARPTCSGLHRLVGPLLHEHKAPPAEVLQVVGEVQQRGVVEGAVGHLGAGQGRRAWRVELPPSRLLLSCGRHVWASCTRPPAPASLRGTLAAPTVWVPPPRGPPCPRARASTRRAPCGLLCC